MDEPSGVSHDLVRVTVFTGDPRSPEGRDLYGYLLQRALRFAVSYSVVADQPRRRDPPPPDLMWLLTQRVPAEGSPSGWRRLIHEPRWVLPSEPRILWASSEAYRFTLWGESGWVFRSDDWGATIDLVVPESYWLALQHAEAEFKKRLGEAHVAPFRKSPLHERKAWTIQRKAALLGFGLTAFLSAVISLLTGDPAWLSGLGVALEPVFVPLREPGPLARMGGRYLVPEESPVNTRLRWLLAVGAACSLVAGMGFPLAWLLGRESALWLPLMGLSVGSMVALGGSMVWGYLLLKPFDRYSFG